MTEKNFPGFGLPVEHENDSGFPLAINHTWSSLGVTLREKRMLEFINQITDKPGWEAKVFDEEIVGRWRQEADVRPPDLDGDVFLSKKMFDFCIAELRDKSTSFKETGRVTILDAELAIVKSDSAVSPSLRESLCQAIKPLEDVPAHLQDWHPGSDKQVLDLVHPSLFPIVWGLSRALTEGTVPLADCVHYTGKGVIVEEGFVITPPASPGQTQSQEESHDPWGRRAETPTLFGYFQWLPSEVVLQADGTAKITSYINNLHPAKHGDLYTVLEQVVAATVPLWEDCLSGFGDRRRFDISGSGSEDYTFPPGLKYRIPGRESPDAYVDPKDEETGGDDEDWRWEDHFYEWKVDNRILEQREPNEYKPQAELAKTAARTGGNLSDLPRVVNFREQFGGNLQVIFKLANIHLTPEKPEYPGGSWHVEGAMNECICASAIYYFDQENITDSHLAFRQSLDTEEIIMIPEQNEHASLEAYLGIANDGPAIQPLGKVLTREGRLLVFPNCVQHQVQSFKLADPTKPGYRKILAMFLVDPHRPILSSAHVPPQRRDWWADEVRKDGGGSLSSLPTEIFDQTVGMVDGFPLSWEQAVDYREQLMAQRGRFSKELTDYMEDQTFSFCEH